MKFATLIEYTPDKAKIAATRPEHRDYLKNVLESGRLVISGPFAGDEGGLLVYEANSREDVEAILRAGSLSARQVDLALRIFRKLAVAEAEVHGIDVAQVHFHEVGALDSIADIAGTAIALDLLGVEGITSRSVPLGTGTIKCAHGTMPIPAPATAKLLLGAPLATTTVRA